MAQQNFHPAKLPRPVLIGSDWAAKYIGIPFVLHGRNASGLDCWGLVRLIYLEQLGIELPNYDVQTTNPRDVGPVFTSRIANELWEQVDGLKAAMDVVLFRVGGYPSHVGIIVDSKTGTFIHVFEGNSVLIDRLSSPAWKNRIMGIFRCRT